MMVIFWDIDGTLLTTARAGVHAWEEALREIAGTAVSLERFDTAGHPDHGIAWRLLSEYIGRSQASEAEVQALVRAYEDRLPSALHHRRGQVLPNVRAILTRLASEPGACSLLLTGNTRRGAAAKLAHYGLLEFFSDGAYSERHCDRSDIARAALERAIAGGCAVEPARVFVVGDTPHDIRCAHAIGARAIAVATGRHSAAELRASAAWRVVPQLPSPDSFLALLAGREVPADV
jgi:phosphoglycolate phosphatase-like HAD superfamily hydrolase